MDELRQGWDRDGYVVLRSAAPADAVAAYPDELAAQHDGLLVRAPGDEHVSLAAGLAPDQVAGAIDPYAIAPAARDLLLAPAIRAWVPTDAAPLLFDAFEASAGAPDDGPYRDATFTALADTPEALTTVVVALGPDAITVAVFPGSHRLETTPFSGRYRHFNPERDGDAALQRHRDELAAGLGEPEIIALEPGDALVWTADLVHRPLDGAALIAHLCPSTVKPGWFAYRPERARCARHGDGAAWLATQHYDLVDAIELDAGEPADAAAEEEHFERIEDALREHDEELATPPQASPPDPPARRGGGLVDSVRGLIGRRGRGNR
jgi:hypothetical protein